MVCCMEKSSRFCRKIGAGTSVARPRVWPAVWRRSGSGLWRSSTDSAPRDSADLNCPRQDLYRIYSKWVDELCFNHQPLYLFHGSKSMVQWINGSMDGHSEFHHFWVDRPMTRPMAVSSWFNPSKRRFALVCHDWCPGREAPGAVAPSLLCNGSVNEGHSLKGVLAKRAGNCWDAMLLHLMLRYAWCANFLRKEIFNGQRIHTGIVLRRAAFGDAQTAPETAETIEIVETGETETGEPIMEDVGGSVSNISRYGKIAANSPGIGDWPGFFESVTIFLGWSSSIQETNTYYITKSLDVFLFVAWPH